MIIKLYSLKIYICFFSLYLLAKHSFSTNFLSFQRVLQTHSKSAHEATQEKGNSNATNNLTLLINEFSRACRYYPTSCLVQALAAKSLLESYGLTPKIHVGCCKITGNLITAHAWLTLNKAVIIGNAPNISEFKEFSIHEHIIK
jgi:hypothetical protein